MTDIVRGVLDKLLPEPLVVVEQRVKAERAGDAGTAPGVVADSNVPHDYPS